MSHQASVRQAAPCFPAPGKFSVFVVLLILALVFVPCLSAQTSQAQDEDEVLRVNTNLIVFPARIRDKNAQRPNALTEHDVALKDPDQVITGLYLSAGVDRVALIFALDQSGSLREIINQQKNAAIELYERFGSKSSVAVLHFSETPQIAVGFARDASQAQTAFAIAAKTNQRTAIFDAAAKAVEMFSALPRVRSERRIVILISDGLDNASQTKSSSVIDAARENSVSFYVIHLPLFAPREGRLAVRNPAKGFRELAEKTGGKYFLAVGSPFAPRDRIDLAPIFKAIEEDLRSQYLIGFYIGEKAHDGKRHHLSLSLPDGFEYQVAGSGYARAHKFVAY